MTTIEMHCVICGKPMKGRRDKKYCSPACRSKAEHRRVKNNSLVPREKVCPKCGKTFEIKGSGYSRRYCFECVPDTMTKGSEVRQLLKKWALEYKGGKCEFCGYCKCPTALEFHHLNPDEKDFIISDKKAVFDWEKTKKELDKCILLCSNCHRELHYKENEERGN